jgi:hypothetical protein
VPSQRSDGEPGACRGLVAGCNPLHDKTEGRGPGIGRTWKQDGNCVFGYCIRRRRSFHETAFAGQHGGTNLDFQAFSSQNPLRASAAKEEAKTDRLTNFLPTHTCPGPKSELQLTARFWLPRVNEKETGKRNEHSQWPANRERRWPTAPSTPFWCSTLGERRWPGCETQNYNR